MLSQAPPANPWVSRTWREYSEQLGSNRHAGGSSGLSTHLIHPHQLGGQARRPRAHASCSFCCALGSGVRPPRQCPEHPLDIATQIGERAAEQRGATHEDHVIPCPLRRALLPIRFAQASPRPIALDRSAQPSANGEADLPLTRTRPPERDEALQLLPPPALPENRLELSRPKALTSAHRQDTAGSPPHAPLDGQPLSPFRPASLQHLSTAQGLHALAESVRLLPAPDIRLKCSLHEVPFRS